MFVHFMRYSTFSCFHTSFKFCRVKLFHNFLDDDWSNRLFDELNEHVPWEQKSDVKNGVRYLQPRVVAWYGDMGYSYSGVNHPPRPQASCYYS